MPNEELQRVAEEHPQDPHENVLQFHREKVQEVDRLLAEHCRCWRHPIDLRVVPHTWNDIHLSVEVCEFASGPSAVAEQIRCMDSMTYLLEDLHDTTWLVHTCLERAMS